MIFLLTPQGRFGTSSRTLNQRLTAPSPSGKAEVCNTFISSSNLLGASNIQSASQLRLALFFSSAKKILTSILS